MSLDEHLKKAKDTEEEVIATRKDGTPVTRGDIEQKMAEIRGDSSPKKKKPKEEPKQEEEPMNDQEPPEVETPKMDMRAEPPKPIEPMPTPTELARSSPTTTEGELVHGDEAKRGELMPHQQEAPITPYFQPGTLTDTNLIDRYKLVENIDYYRIGSKAIFQKEGLLKLIPLVRVGGYGISHEIIEIIDDPTYKRVKIRAWIGPKEDPVRVAEATTDWRSELNEADIILKALKNKQLKETALISKEGNYSIDWVKHPALLQKLLRNSVFALRITEGKALRRVWGIMAGVTAVPMSEIKVLAGDVETVQQETRDRG